MRQIAYLIAIAVVGAAIYLAIGSVSQSQSVTTTCNYTYTSCTTSGY